MSYEWGTPENLETTALEAHAKYEASGLKSLTTEELRQLVVWEVWKDSSEWEVAARYLTPRFVNYEPRERSDLMVQLVHIYGYILKE